MSDPVVISGIGTGGTLTGIGEALKKRKPDLKMIAVEPEDSPILSGGVTQTFPLNVLASVDL